MIWQRMFFNLPCLYLVINFIQEKYEKAMASLAQMEKRAVMAESMLEATMQYESGQVKALASPGCVIFCNSISLLFWCSDLFASWII